MRVPKLLVMLGLTTALVSGCTQAFPGTRVEYATGDGSNNESAPDCEPYASTLAGLVEVSDKVVVATVTQVTPKVADAYVGSDISDGATTPLVRTGDYLNRDLTLAVERTISDQGRLPLGQVEVPGWTARGDGPWTSFDINNNHRLAVGDRAVLALVNSPTGGHGLLCTGPFVLKDGQVVAKESAGPEFAGEGPTQVSAYDMTEQQLIDTLTGLATAQGTSP